MNKQLIKSRFAKSLQTYEQQADVQKLIAGTLALKAGEYLPASCDSLLEIGCGTGFLTRELVKQVTVKDLWLNDLVDELALHYTDLSDQIKEQTALRFIPGDAEQITFPSEVDCIMSASAIQWMTDLPRFFKKVNEALLPGGFFIFNTYGPSNFQEIRSLIGSGLPYPDMSQLQKMLGDSFEIREAFEETHIRHFDSPGEVLRHLQQTGVTATDSSFAWNKKKLHDFNHNYRLFFSENGKVILTWQVYYFVCRKSL
ncbi:malonyl-ACP O-methyltransferase BioC [Parabacteroides sp. FAFU027]|uniref:malonyl-ACP O-methyltransferase BioC n=1 Tax=Parabacteroides sp. FAFU027 TaxID=2922715 RepID=UPI001FAF14CA|nr:malonyl-ACP O-methyltransferase BioC [Parabacteroides sp. FAFU027]